MIVLDTCSAMKCYSLSKNWLDRLKKCCADKKVLWSTTTNYELIGLSTNNKSLEDLIQRLSDAENVESLSVDGLSEENFLQYLDYLSDISNNDSILLYNQFPKIKTNLTILQVSGKDRLSEEDREIIALSMIMNAALATDDVRILKMLDEFYPEHPYLCTPKIIQKIKNITTIQQLKNICHPKQVWIYANYHTNNTAVC